MPAAHRKSSYRHAHPRSARTTLLRRRGYIRVTEAARLVGVSRLTVYRWLQSQRVHGLYDNGAYYVHGISLVHTTNPSLIMQLESAGVGTEPGSLPEGAREIGSPSPSPVADGPVAQ